MQRYNEPIPTNKNNFVLVELFESRYNLENKDQVTLKQLFQPITIFIYVFQKKWIISKSLTFVDMLHCHYMLICIMVHNEFSLFDIYLIILS